MLMPRNRKLATRQKVIGAKTTAAVRLLAVSQSPHRSLLQMVGHACGMNDMPCVKR